MRSWSFAVAALPEGLLRSLHCPLHLASVSGTALTTPLLGTVPESCCAVQRLPCARDPDFEHRPACCVQLTALPCLAWVQLLVGNLEQGSGVACLSGCKTGSMQVSLGRSTCREWCEPLLWLILHQRCRAMEVCTQHHLSVLCGVVGRWPRTAERLVPETLECCNGGGQCTGQQTAAAAFLGWLLRQSRACEFESLIDAEAEPALCDVAEHQTPCCCDGQRHAGPYVLTELSTLLVCLVGWPASLSPGYPGPEAACLRVGTRAHCKDNPCCAAQRLPCAVVLMCCLAGKTLGTWGGIARHHTSPGTSRASGSVLC